VVPLLLTLFTLEMGIAVVVEAILSFVGLSVSSDMPTWGGLVQEGRLYVNQTPWLLGLIERRPPNVVAVAIANKMARIAWALMARGGIYRSAPELAA